MNQSHMTEIFISIGVCAFGLLLLLLRPLYDLAARVSQAKKEYHALLRNGLMSDAPKENDRLLAERLAEGAKASPPAAEGDRRISAGPKQPERRIPPAPEREVHPSPGPPTAPLEPPKPSPVRIRLKSGQSAAPPSERSSI